MNGQSVIDRLADLAQIGRYDGGIDRPLATPQERAARERFAGWVRANNYALWQDRVGNVFARRAGTGANAAPILLGSHLDTVRTGGPYDGAYGVTGALCVLDILTARNISTVHPVEAVAWAGEEGSRFPLGCLGSSVFADLFSADAVLALRDAQGTSLGEALASPQGGLLKDVAMRERYKPAAYLELHIEQGPILEREGIRLGVVTAIAGQRRYQVTVAGESGHAGTVPMSYRHDALLAAAELVLAVETLARRAGNVVATVGRMSVEPGGTNVIPLRTVFSLDVRCEDDTQLDIMERAFRDRALGLERDRGVVIAVDRLEVRTPAPMDEGMRQSVHRAIASLPQRAIDVPSGAGHDAMCLAQIVPCAMIFVPSIGGRSHVGEERTSDEDLALGVEALAAAVIEVDRTVD